MRLARRVVRLAASITIAALGWAETDAAHAQATAAPTATSAKAETCGRVARHVSTEDQGKACLAAAGRSAAMRGDKLVLRMDDGTRKTFDNGKRDPNDDTPGYTLLDFYPDTHVFLVALVGIDDSTFTLVDGRTGTETEMGSAYPVYSPDRDWIFAFTSNEGGGDGPDVAIYDAHGAKPKKVWSKTNLPAGTDFVGWDDDTTMRLSTGKGPRFLKRDAGGAWQLTSPAAAQTAPPPTAAPQAASPGRWSCRAGPQSTVVDTQNRTCLALAGSFAAEAGDTLVLRMDDGTEKRFKDTDLSGELGYGYALVDFYPATHRFVVGNSGPDKTTYTVIDGHSGREARLGHAQPYFSPKGDVYVAITDASVKEDTYKVELATAAGATIPFTAQGQAEMPYSIVRVVWTGDDTARLIDFNKKDVILARGADQAWHLQPAPVARPVEPPGTVPPLKPAPAKDIARCGITGDDANANQSVSDACALMLGAKAEKNTDTNILTLTLADGQTRRFAGSADTPRAKVFSTYNLLAYSRDAHVFVLSFVVTGIGGDDPSLGEARSQFVTVDTVTGRTKIFPAFPAVSPHGDTALTIGEGGTLDLYDMTAAWTKKIWSWPAAGTKAASSTSFLGWVDDTSVRVLLDDANVLTVANGADGWHAVSAPLRPTYDVAHLSTACKVGRPNHDDDFTPREASCLAALLPIASRKGQVLTLKLEGGRSKRLISVERGADDMIDYRLIGFYPAVHAFVVFWSAYENSDVVIVDSVTGDETSIQGFPVFASDARHFAVTTFGSDVEPTSDVTIFAAQPTFPVVWSYDRPPIDVNQEPDILGWPTNAKLDLKIDGRPISVVAGPDGKWTAPDIKSAPAAETPAKSP